MSESDAPEPKGNRSPSTQTTHGFPSTALSTAWREDREEPERYPDEGGIALHLSSGADRGARASASVASVVPTGHGCVSGEAGCILHMRATASTHGVLGPRQGHSHPQLSDPTPSSHIHLGTFTGDQC